ncbi:glycosyltransferase family 2 protein [uncultured Phascolarctobacterium sp.]|uniref:glycosyltransferase family 2 protein n=1 Tax=uncultured Phascolarctobacterium sp. TaxID=512296 RepID=UPI0025D838D7|nr:glycosyltransferase family 2 protein [uncultured Phascolarctobacterium sp.]
MSKLSVVILTKNEEANIADVVQNARQLTDCVLVVDSGSTDKTVPLAEANGARVIYRAWDDDFSAQRNFALQHIATEWVLYLDADERLNQELCSAIKAAAANHKIKQYSMMRKIHAFGFTYMHGIFKPDEVLRLFPSDKVHWVNKVHEHPVCDLPKEKLKGFIEHYTYTCWQQWWDKAGNYTTIWAQDNYERGKKTSLAACFGHAAYGFLRAYFLQLGFVDGWSGLYSSLQHFIYTMMKYLKLYELQNK